MFFGRRPPFVYDNPKFSRAGGGHKAVVVQRATGPITIDGSARNWPGVPAEQIASSRLVEGSDAGGVEGVFKLCWDQRNLYLLARVTDPTPMRNEHKGDMLWSGDGIELFIGHEKPDQPGRLLFSDRQVLLGAGKPDGQCHWYFVRSRKQYAVQMTVLPSVDGKGYTLEAAIPFDALGFAPKEGQEVLFDMAIDNSEDGSGRAPAAGMERDQPQQRRPHGLGPGNVRQVGGRSFRNYLRPGLKTNRRKGDRPMRTFAKAVCYAVFLAAVS